MPGQSFRFLHASSLHLEASLSGILEAPEHLTAALAAAPFAAAENVLDAAIREEVDFVVLSGDVLDPTSAGPRAVAFLTEQFEALAAREIAVYWAASKLDLTSGWLSTLKWPDNVRIFSSERVQGFKHSRGDVPIAHILGRSWRAERSVSAGEFPREAGDVFSLAVVPGRLHVDAQQPTPVGYWAVGGGERSETPAAAAPVVHGPGSPQGFQPDHTGPRGCTLVHVDSESQVRTRMIACDAVRWCHERLNLTAGVARQTVQQEMQSRLEALIRDADRPLLVHWTASGLGRFDTAFVRAPQRDEVLQWLRRKYGSGSPPAWSTSFALEPPHALRAEWCEEDSILGDFMRVVQTYQEEDHRAVDLEPFLADRRLPSGIAAKRLLAVGDDRDALLNRAAVMGLDLLRGDDALPHEHSRSSS